MNRLLAPFALVVLAAPALAQQGPANDPPQGSSQAAPAVPETVPVPQLSLEHRMVLRCGAAFAMVAFGQENGNEDALKYPPIEQTGADFFAVEVDRVMREADLDDEQIVAALSAEADELYQKDQLDEIMPACLSMLDQ